ncbi:beta strand repeat-containing protein [Fructobacillus ficulneus]|uniref:beta strand repeat-containing protein n=1 Tax=Fructobacillus ficulneus TaxID=157463 RepID=UPI0011E4D407|nr:DUF1542 domain-containing protein [Fructobacillus ficulneus]
MGNNATITITGAKLSAYSMGNKQASDANPAGNTSAGGTMVINSNTTTLTNLDGSTNSVSTGNLREILGDNRQGNGQVQIQYVNGAGTVIKTGSIDVSNFPTYYPGTTGSIVNQASVYSQMPANFSWAIGSEIPASKSQPTTFMVPVAGQTNVYTVYVYGKPEAVQYQYVDENTGKVLSGQLAGQSGTEPANGTVTANFGNVIDWTNKYYIQTNVPSGYSYDANNKQQPKQVTVTDGTQVITIYVQGNQQNITPSYQSDKGVTLNPTQTTTISGRTGQTLSSLPQPSVDGFSIYQTMVNGQVVDPTQPYTIGLNNTITFLYQSNADRTATLIKGIYAEETKQQGVIDADPTLNAAARQSEYTSLAKARTTAINALNAISGNNLNTVYAQQIALIDAVHTSNPSVASQKASLLADLQTTANNTDAAINADTSLTDATKASQKAAVATDLTNGQNAINNATLIDDIYSAHDKASAAITAEHQAGESVGGQQADAKGQISGSAGSAHNAINGDNTLTAADKARENAAVDAANSQANTDITNATTAQQIADAVTKGLKAINAAHIAGPAISTQQSTATAKVAQAASAAIGTITADSTLTDDQKAQQSKAVFNYASPAESTINNSQDAQTIADTANAAIDKIDGVHQPGQSLTNQEAQAQSDLTAYATKIKGDIDADSLLTDAQKTHDKAGVDSAAATGATSIINNASTAQGIAANLASAEAAVLNQHEIMPALTAQQSSANQDLATEESKVVAAINADVNLTSDQKQQQVTNAGTALSKAQAAVNAATNAQGIVDAQTAGKTNIDGQHQVPQTLADRKAAKVGELQQRASADSSSITGDNDLTQAAQKTATDQITKDLAAAIANVNAANDADDVDSAAQNGETTMDGDVTTAKQGVTPLATQQANAIQELQKRASDNKNAITQDNDLTGAQQSAATSQIDTDLATAVANVKNAGNADAVIKAQGDGDKTLDGDVTTAKSGISPLADQKTTAKATLASNAQNIKNAIDNDPTIASADKVTDKANVDTDLAAAQKNVDNATNADGVSLAVTNGNQKMNADHPTTQTLDQQKAAAKAALQQTATDTKNAINADPTLTQKTQQAYDALVDSDLSTAQGNVDNAKDADDIANARNNGQNAIKAEHKNGEALDSQKADAKAVLQQKATDTKAAIDGDVNLLKATQQTYDAAVDADLAAANTNIGNATTADQINTARDNGTGAIAAEHKAGTPLSQQVSAAKQTLANLAQSVKNDISNDKTLTSGAKASQSSTVDSYITQAGYALDKIVQSGNADDVVNTVNSYSTSIRNTHQAADLTQEKAAAKSALEQKASDINQSITNDSGLTSAAQSTDKTNVQTALSNAEKNVDNATDADTIDSVRDAGLTAIGQQYTAATPLATQQSTAIGNLEKTASDNTNTINQNNNLFKADQSAATKQIAADLASAKAAVTAATNADGVNSAVSTWTATLNQDASSLLDSQTPLQTRKDTEVKALQTTATTNKGTITADNNLLHADQKTATDKIDADLATAIANVNAANDADDVTSAAQAGQTQLNTDVTNAQANETPLATRQANAVAALQKKASDDTAAITGDNNLLKSDQKKATDQIATDLATAISNVNNAKNADDVDAANQAGQTQLDTDVKNAKANETPLATRQANAVAELKQKASDNTNAITSDNNLLQADQKTATDKIAADLQAAENAVNGAGNADDVDAAAQTGQNQLDADVTNAKSNEIPLATQKTNAVNALQQAANNVNDKINANTDLTSVQKTAALDQVQKDLTNGTNAVNAGTNADIVANALKAGQGSLAIDLTNAQSLGTQKTAAIKTLTQNASDATSSLNNDNDLTGDQKAAAAKQIAQDLSDATDKINDATTTDSINTALTNGQNQISKDEAAAKQVTPLATQKSTANGQLSDAAQAANGRIDADPDLTSDQKTAGKKAVNDAMTAAQAKVTAETNADGVNGAQSDGDTAIKTAETNAENVTPLATQKATAKTNLASAAKDASDSIDQDPDLTTDQGAAAKKTIATDLTNAQTAVDNATDADGVNNAYTAGTGQITTDEAAAKKVTPLADQKANANKKLQTAEQNAIEGITNNPDLTGDQQNLGVAAIKMASSGAQKAVTAATNADGVNGAQSDGATAITTAENNAKKVTPLATQKTTAKTNLASAAKDASDSIDQDNDLTTDQKAAAKKTIATDLTNAQTAVDNATNADGVNNAYTAGTGQITTDEASAKKVTPLGTQQTNAKTELSNAAQAASDRIDKDNDLTTDQKAAGKKAVNDAMTAAQAKVTAATNADGVNGAQSDGDTAIQTAETNAEKAIPLATQKTTAKTNLASAAQTASDSIDQDNDLTTDQKAAAKKTIATDLTNAQSTVDNATDADGVNNAYTAGTGQITKDEAAAKNVTPLDTQKSKANDQLASDAETANGQIDADSNLTADQKAAGKKAVNDAMTAAQAKVTAATNADGVNSAQSDGATAITTAETNAENVSSLTTQKTAATTDLSNKAQAAKDAINNNPALTSDQKKSYSDQVDADLSKATSAVNNATDADDVNKANSAGDAVIAGDANSATSAATANPLSAQKTAATTDLSNKAQAAKDAINGNAALTGDQKKAASDKVDADLSKATDNVNNATDADDVNKANSEGDTAIAGDANAAAAQATANPLSAQKTAATNDLDKDAQTAKDAINGNPALTSDQKKSYSDKVDADLSKATDAVNNATDADAVNNANSAGATAISGDDSAAAAQATSNPLPAQKTAATTDLSNKAQAAKDAINNNPALTSDQKKAASDKVDADLSKATDNVNNATDADDVNKANSDGDAAIAGDANAASSAATSNPLSAQKTAATTDLGNKAQAAKDAINNNPALTSDQKKAASDKVDADLSKATDNVNNATDADDVNKANSDGDAAIAGDANAASSAATSNPLSAQKTAATTDLGNKAQDAKNAINGNAALTSDQKKSYSDKVDADLSKATDNVNNATDADDVNKANSEGDAAIASDANAATAQATSNPLPAQKTAATTDLSNKAQAAKDAINNNPALTSDQKKSYSNQVDADLSKATDNVNNATDADDVNKANSDGDAAMNNDTKVATDAATSNPLPAQKTAATTDLSNKAKAAKDAINNNPALTSDQKKAASDKVDADLSKATDNVNNATDADDVNKANSDGDAAIAGDANAAAAQATGNPLPAQKTTATSNLNQAAQNAKTAINNNPALTSGEKKAATDQVDKDLAAAQAAVEAATDADGVNKAVSDGENQIANDAQNAANIATNDSLPNQRSTATTELDNKANAAKDAINNNPALTGDQKKAATGQIDKDLAAAKAAVNAATDADDINSRQSAGDSAIDNDAKSASDAAAANPLPAQKQTASDGLDKKAQAAKDAINNNPALTGDQKKAATDQIDKDLADATNAINNASDADGVNKAISAGDNAIDNDAKSAADAATANPLPAQKTAATTNLNQKAQDAKDAINNNPALTGDQKKAATDQIDKDLADATNAVNNASDADGVNKANSDGDAAIDKDSQSATNAATSNPLPGQKTDATNSLNKKAQDDKDAINRNPALTGDQKNAAINKINSDLAKATDAVNNASDADGVNKALNDGNAALDVDFNTPTNAATPLSTQKQNATNSLKQKAQSDKDAINGNSALTSDQKKAATDKIDGDLASATNAINTASNADGVNKALSDGNAALDSDLNTPQNAASPLPAQKSTATNNLNQKAQAAKDAINNNPALTGDQKKAATDKIDNDLAAATDAVNNATNADGVNQAISDGNNAIDNDSKAATDQVSPLPAQRQAATDALNRKAQDERNAIDADKDLTSDEKKAAHDQVDRDLAAAQSAVNTAGDADGVNKALNDGNANLDRDLNSAQDGEKPLPTQRQSAVNDLRQKAQTVKDAISVDNDLTTAQKQAASDQVDKDLTAAENAVGAATDADSINRAISDGDAQLDRDQHTGTPLAEQKASVTETIQGRVDDLIAAMKTVVDADPTQLQNRINELNNLMTRLNQDLSAATNADEVQEILARCNAIVDGDYQPFMIFSLITRTTAPAEAPEPQTRIAIKAAEPTVSNSLSANLPLPTTGGDQDTTVAPYRNVEKNELPDEFKELPEQGSKSILDGFKLDYENAFKKLTKGGRDLYTLVFSVLSVASIWPITKTSYFAALKKKMRRRNIRK